MCARTPAIQGYHICGFDLDDDGLHDHFDREHHTKLAVMPQEDARHSLQGTMADFDPRTDGEIAIRLRRHARS